MAYDAAGILWLTYIVTDGAKYAAAVDKSCDNGATWSGALPGTTGSEGSFVWPSFALTPGNAPHLLAVSDDQLASIPLSP